MMKSSLPRIVFSLVVVAILSFVSVVLAQQEEAASVETTKSSWSGRVDADVLSVRARPGTNYEVVSKLQRGDIVEIVSEQDGWMEIYAPEDSRAWCARQFVSDEGVITGNQVRVRAGPGLVFSPYYDLPEGAKVEMLGESRNGWQQILVPKEATVWIHGEFVSALKETEQPAATAEEAAPVEALAAEEAVDEMLEAVAGDESEELNARELSSVMAPIDEETLDGVESPIETTELEDAVEQAEAVVEREEHILQVEELNETSTSQELDTEALAVVGVDEESVVEKTEEATPSGWGKTVPDAVPDKVEVESEVKTAAVTKPDIEPDIEPVTEPVTEVAAEIAVDVPKVSEDATVPSSPEVVPISEEDLDQFNTQDEVEIVVVATPSDVEDEDVEAVPVLVVEEHAEQVPAEEQPLEIVEMVPVEVPLVKVPEVEVESQATRGTLVSLGARANAYATHVVADLEDGHAFPKCYLVSSRVNLREWENREVCVYGEEVWYPEWSRPTVRVSGVQLLDTLD
jgi:uncharacterized protein YgiM (DUF1202 family)